MRMDTIQKLRVSKIYFSFLKGLQYFFRYKPYYLSHLLLFYLTRVLKPDPVPLISEKESFKDLNKIWHPKESSSRIILKWIMTEWCNYNCLYCPQEHSRERIRASYRVHCFDNHTPGEWINALDSTFKRNEVVLTISGGEPMLDMNNMRVFLTMLVPRTYINNIRIVTNLAWNPLSLKNLPNKEKVIFLLTFHPSQTKFENFITRAKKLEQLGFSIGMVNYVMTPEKFLQYKKLQEKFKKINLPLHPNILWYSKIDKDLENLKEILGEVDFYYNTGGTTKGATCLFPSIGYEMNQNGDIYLGCFPWISGNIFKGEIPKLIEGPVKCPYYQCHCFDKYSFIKGFNRNTDLNILKIYGNLLRKRLGMQKI